MRTTTLRRLAAAAIAVISVGAASAPAASADTMLVRTDTSVVQPYDQTALLSPYSINQAKGPVMIRVRHTIQCVRGKVRRSGYPAMCQWSSGIFGGTATMGQQGQGDFYVPAWNGYAAGNTFHAGTLREGQSTVDEWAVLVRNNPSHPGPKTFKMSISSTGGGSLVRTFTIV